MALLGGRVAGSGDSCCFLTAIGSNEVVLLVSLSFRSKQMLGSTSVSQRSESKEVSNISSIFESSDPCFGGRSVLRPLGTMQRSKLYCLLCSFSRFRGDRRMGRPFMSMLSRPRSRANSTSISLASNSAAKLPLMNLGDMGTLLRIKLIPKSFLTSPSRFNCPALEIGLATGTTTETGCSASSESTLVAMARIKTQSRSMSVIVVY